MRQWLGLCVLNDFFFNLLTETRLHLLGVASNSSRSQTVSVLLMFTSQTTAVTASATNDKLLNLRAKLLMWSKALVFLCHHQRDVLKITQLCHHLPQSLNL